MRPARIEKEKVKVTRKIIPTNFELSRTSVQTNVK